MKVKPPQSLFVSVRVVRNMADAAVKTLDSLTCPICLDLLRDPVAIPCGHSFCLDCIKDCWHRDDQRGVYSCPQCRHTFTSKPVLNKNTMLAELAEAMRTTEVQAAADPPSLPAAAANGFSAGSEGEECDVCTGRKRAAVKSCLVCLASYCQAHLLPHFEISVYKKHKLVEVSVNQVKNQEKNQEKPQEKINAGSLLDKRLELEVDHIGRRRVSAAAERAEKQKMLVETRKESKQRIQQIEKNLWDLRQARKTLRCSAQAAEEDSEEIFTELIQSVKRRHSEVKELIQTQERAELRLAEELGKKLEKEITDLRRRDAKLEMLLRSEDHDEFLKSFQSFKSSKSFQSLSASSQPTHSSQIPTSPQFSMKKLKKAVSGVMEQVDPKLLKFSGGFSSFSKMATPLQKPQKPLPPPKPKMREVFLKFSCQLTLDPNTANRSLALSERNRKVSALQQHRKLRYPDHPERFDQVRQVLCRESLCGRSYWEVEIRASDVNIAVAYKSISRKGEDHKSGFGSNHQSWSLFYYSSSSTGPSFFFRHNKKYTELPAVSRSRRVGVYVDPGAGFLSFYSVSDTLTLLHRVQTTFTQPLYPGFGVYGCDDVLQICDHN
uniref:Tripartite motif-containing protein 16-like n=1 Tax=Astyanax mexicanus TaxID=7994 RepID=A0A3B1K191_ASTMX